MRRHIRPAIGSCGYLFTDIKTATIRRQTGRIVWNMEINTPAGLTNVLVINKAMAMTTAHQYRRWKRKDLFPKDTGMGGTPWESLAG
jgi:hypothetical protein